jgi:hypothetical protein
MERYQKIEKVSVGRMYMYVCGVLIDGMSIYIYIFAYTGWSGRKRR